MRLFSPKFGDKYAGDDDQAAEPAFSREGVAQNDSRDECRKKGFKAEDQGGPVGRRDPLRAAGKIPISLPIG